jgi:hypothetical protein
VVKLASTNQHQAHQAHGDDHFDEGKSFCFHGSWVNGFRIIRFCSVSRRSPAKH